MLVINSSFKPYPWPCKSFSMFSIPMTKPPASSSVPQPSPSYFSTSTLTSHAASCSTRRLSVWTSFNPTGCSSRGPDTSTRRSPSPSRTWSSPARSTCRLPCNMRLMMMITMIESKRVRKIRKKNCQVRRNSTTIITVMTRPRPKTMRMTGSLKANIKVND